MSWPTAAYRIVLALLALGRRWVAGQRGERYYTEDHYQGFRRIQEGA